MIKTLTLLLSLMCCVPSVLRAQETDVLFPRISRALARDSVDRAVTFFRQAAEKDVEQAEMFYWTQVDKTQNVAVLFSAELARSYQKERSFDKAYLFCQEYLQRYPDDLRMLELCASASLMRGEEEEAADIYRSILRLDNDNLQANIFLGNYYFLQGERERDRLHKSYFHIKTPTRMQYARYRNRLSDIFRNTYSKARDCLRKAARQMPSDGTQHTLDLIEQIRKEAER